MKTEPPFHWWLLSDDSNLLPRLTCTYSFPPALLGENLFLYQLFRYLGLQNQSTPGV